MYVNVSTCTLTSVLIWLLQEGNSDERPPAIGPQPTPPAQPAHSPSGAMLAADERQIVKVARMEPASGDAQSDYTQPARSPASTGGAYNQPTRSPASGVASAYSQPARSPAASTAAIYAQPARSPASSGSAYSQPARSPASSGSAYSQPARSPASTVTSYNQPVRSPASTAAVHAQSGRSLAVPSTNYQAQFRTGSINTLLLL